MTDLARLRLLAEAATAGPWATYLHFHVVQASVPDDDVIDDETWFSADLYGPKSAADAAYIAAFNPTTAAALLDEIESWAAWIVRADDAKHSTDWACAECVAQVQGHPDSVVDGFRCVPHRARAALLEAEPLDPEGAAR